MPADNQPGFGRIDALTNIVNEITVGDLGVPGNVRVANAPVSVPHVWDAPQHNVVQWNGSIPNAGAGPALRNIGEVLGTFGTLDIEPKPGKLPNYPNTSAETKNLNAPPSRLCTERNRKRRRPNGSFGAMLCRTRQAFSRPLRCTSRSIAR